MARPHLVIGMVVMFFSCLADSRTLTKTFEKPQTDTLQLLHVVFRHGDRTPADSYPNDPYQDEPYYPVGLGHLTDAGKMREYKIGSYLRGTYNNFLNDTYHPGIVVANASSVLRCRASVELVLAGLYPPSSIQNWNDRLKWQAIPYDYTPMEEDLLFWPSEVCSRYNSYIESYLSSETYQTLYEQYTDVLSYLQENSGIESKRSLGMSLYSSLKSQEEWGLTLPEWTDSVWPQPITEITQLDWKQLYPTEETRAIGGGFLMSKIINDTQLKLSGDASVEDTKIYLYSGHDTNIVAVLSWLGSVDLHIPQYGSFIIFEIHNIDGVPTIRIALQNYENDVPQVISIPNCGYYCPLDTVIGLYADYLNPYDLCS